MLRTKLKYENKQSAITKKLSKQEIRFMCTALPLHEIYQPKRFHKRSYYSFGDMLWTKNWMPTTHQALSNMSHLELVYKNL